MGNLFRKILAAIEDIISTAVSFAPNILAEPLYRFYEGRLRKGFTRTNLPHHVAVLADGNRRWARLNAPKDPYEVGYQAGADKLVEFVKWCQDVHIEIVTLWVLSTDNLKRSLHDELEPLLEVIVGLVDRLAQTNQVKIVGDLSLLPQGVAERLREAETRSQNKFHRGKNTDLVVNVAVSYGGRQELLSAVKSLLKEEAQTGKTLSEVAETIDLEQISEHLYTSGTPDPDLIIRTSGEQRLSGFLMWQSAHSEFYFCEALWPDFRKVDFYRALRSYSQRERRFGK